MYVGQNKISIWQESGSVGRPETENFFWCGRFFFNGMPWSVTDPSSDQLVVFSTVLVSDCLLQQLSLQSLAFGKCLFSFFHINYVDRKKEAERGRLHTDSSCRLSVQVSMGIQGRRTGPRKKMEGVENMFMREMGCCGSVLLFLRFFWFAW